MPLPIPQLRPLAAATRADNTWRLYNTQHAGLAEQTFELQLRSRWVARSLRSTPGHAAWRVRRFPVAAGDAAGRSARFPHVLYPTAGLVKPRIVCWLCCPARCRRGLGLGGAGSGAGGAGRAAVAFSFGPPELWQRFSLYFLTGDGSLWCLCPVVPFGETQQQPAGSSASAAGFVLGCPSARYQRGTAGPPLPVPPRNDCAAACPQAAATPPAQ